MPSSWTWPEFGKPRLLELIGGMMLTPSEYRRVFNAHDPGDEQPRRYALFVCGIRRCGLDPNHFGPHEPDPAPPAPSNRPMVRRWGVLLSAREDAHHDPGDEDVRR